MGRSTDPHVSAAQWTNPDAKSAVSIPATEIGLSKYRENHSNKERTANKDCDKTTTEHYIMFQSAPTNTQQDVPQMSQVEIGKKVNEIEGQEREAEDDT